MFLFKFTASTLKCWRCTNDAENAAFCNDPFDESAVTPEQRKWVYTECSNSPQPETKKPTSTTTIPVCKKVIEMSEYCECVLVYIFVFFLSILNFKT